MSFIKVKVHPKSKKNNIKKIKNDQFELWIKEKAERGMANQATTTLLAEHLQIPVKKLRLIKGAHQKNKIFQIIDKIDLKT